MELPLKILGIGLLLMLASVTSAIKKENYPNIKTDPAKCWPHGRIPQKLRICDPDDLLSDSEALALQSEVMEIEATTRCPCHHRKCDVWRWSGQHKGYSVSVALTESMETDETDLVSAARRYADELRINRGYYGPEYSSRCEEDIIIFLSLKERAVYVLTGSKAKQRVSDTKLSNIIMQSKDEFAKSLAEGLQYVIQGIRAELPSL